MKMKASQQLRKEIEQYNNATPNVLMFVDETAIFWVTCFGFYVWIQDHKGMNDYIDADHQPQSRMPTLRSTEGVGNTGVYWMNADFGNPFHVSDFIEATEARTV